MAERQMSPKGFLHKSNTKAAHSAAGFLAAHRAWLTTGKIAAKTSSILRKMDAGILLPTPALREIQFAVMAHMVESDREKLEASLEQQAQAAKPKAWMAAIFDANDHLVEVETEDGLEALSKEFEDASPAQRWIDRQLVDGCPDWYGILEMTANSRIRSVIPRGDSIARVLRKKKGPAVHAKGTSTKTLGFGVRAKQDRASFSRG